MGATIWYYEEYKLFWIRWYPYLDPNSPQGKKDNRVIRLRKISHTITKRKSK